MSPIERTPGGGGSGGTPVGTQLDYVQITATVTVTSTNPAIPTNVITGNTITYDGTRIKIEFYAPVIEVNSTGTGNSLAIDVWDGATDLAEIAGAFISSNSTVDLPSYGVLFVTPTAAAHTYSIKASRGVPGNNPLIAAGAGGAATFAPAFIRVTKA